MNGHTIDLSRLAEDPLSNKLKAELDRSIAKHLEAGKICLYFRYLSSEASSYLKSL